MIRRLIIRALRYFDPQLDRLMDQSEVAQKRVDEARKRLKEANQRVEDMYLEFEDCLIAEYERVQREG